MKKEWVLTQDVFDSLLDWLDADRERAGKKYETIRLRLIKIFTCRGCLEAEDLTDETINRVTVKVEEIATTYSGDPALYFYGVAQKVHQEYLREPRAARVPETVIRHSVAQPAPATQTSEDTEAEYECLDRCMERLPSDNRRLVIEYYQEQKQAKIEHRKQLARELGIAVNALRIRAHRIRLLLQQCVQTCLEQEPAQ